MYVLFLFIISLFCSSPLYSVRLPLFKVTSVFHHYIIINFVSDVRQEVVQVIVQHDV